MSRRRKHDEGRSGGRQTIPLQHWLWRSFLRTAIVPLLVIELTFLVIYWISSSVVYRENTAALSEISHQYLNDVARREAMGIDERLTGVSRATELFARQALGALRSGYVAPPQERARYARGPGGALYTQYDNGTTAGFYSNRTAVGPAELAKVWKLTSLGPLMKDIKESHPLVASLYFNSHDSYNHIYPYMPLAGQLPSDMDIPKYNFYYEADAAHNPARKAVWTDAYIDPVGHGWMVSSIAPVWNGDKLEGVVGLDITLDTIVKRVLSLSLPWKAYAVLLDRQGRIVAMPPAAERDLGLRELTQYTYSNAIHQDTFKPDAYNLRLRKDTAPLARALASGPNGHLNLDLNGPRVVSFARIAGPQWTLVIVAPEERILQGATTLRQRLQTVGYIMLAGLLLFYALYFAFLYQRARTMSVRLARPINEIARLVDRIALGEYRQSFVGSSVSEMDSLGHKIVHAGYQLGDAHDQIVAQERIVSEVLGRERQVHEEQARFLRIMSHELRTPLSVIDSGAQILDRKAETLTPDNLRQRSSRIRAAVRRISDLLQKITPTVTSPRADVPVADETCVPVATLVERTAREVVPSSRLDLRLDGREAEINRSERLRMALRAALHSVIRDAPAAASVRVDMSLASETEARVVILADLASMADKPGLTEPSMPLGSDLAGVGQSADVADVGLFSARSLLEAAGGTMTIAPSAEGNIVTFTFPVMVSQDA